MPAAWLMWVARRLLKSGLEIDLYAASLILRKSVGLYKHCRFGNHIVSLCPDAVSLTSPVGEGNPESVLGENLEL